MPDNVTRFQRTITEPFPGFKVEVAAQYFIVKRVADLLGMGGLRDAMRGGEREVQDIIGRSVLRRYNRSGLRKLSGNLLRNALRFDVVFEFSGNRIFVRAQWLDPDIPYFFIHLFGGEIRPVRAKALRFKIGDKTIFAQKVRIPARPFIRFDRQAANQIEAVINRRIDAAVQRARIGEARRAREPARRRPGRVSLISGREARLAARLAKRVGVEARIERELRGRRVTPRKIRTALRRGLGIEFQESRELAGALVQEGAVSAQAITALLFALRGQFVERRSERPQMRITPR